MIAMYRRCAVVVQAVSLMATFQVWVFWWLKLILIGTGLVFWSAYFIHGIHRSIFPA